MSAQALLISFLLSFTVSFPIFGKARTYWNNRAGVAAALHLMVHQFKGTDKLAPENLVPLGDGGVGDNATHVRFAGYECGLLHPPPGAVFSSTAAIDCRVVAGSVVERVY